jgi:hypothetical protein
MEQDELLRTVVLVLERLEIPYLITGSIATIFYGEPRFTNDIDIVVWLTAGREEELAREFSSPEFYLSREAVKEARDHRRQFNLIHPASGLKVDFIIAAENPFNRSRLARAVKVRPAPDFEASFASPEDVILMKMEYYRRGGSDRHLRDIVGVLKVSGEDLDQGYIETWAGELGLTSIWKDIRSSSSA